MAHLTALTETNDNEDCQLVSFTNKLPYYVRHLYKSTNKNKTATVTSKPSEYLIDKYQILFSDLRREKIEASS